MRGSDDYFRIHAGSSPLIVLIVAIATGLWPAGLSAAPRFRVRLLPEASSRPYSGRVYVLFSGSHEPRLGPNWFHPAPMLAVDVQNLAPGGSVELTIPAADGGAAATAALAFPKGLEPGALVGLKAQAVVRLNPFEREVGTGPGNGYSDVVVVPTGDTELELVVDKIVSPALVTDTEWTKVLRVRSKLLSDFHGRSVDVLGAVRLPPSYFDAPERRFPVIFEVPGFGGGLRQGMHETPAPAGGEVEFLHVVLDPNCPLGHHVFADSANNGPVGRALVEEFIPALDRKYRTTGKGSGRFLTGHSSGGWSSLWLQVTYPETFNGTWSTAPDPVDFRDFQRIDLYRRGENMYFDAEGERRPLARLRGRPAIWYDDFAQMEEVLGPGGQLHSFEAVFSERGADGRPRRIWDRKSGAVDRAVAETWKRYDIRLIVEENWPVLGPRLRGKLHVFMGDVDTFYLEGATKLLGESLKGLGSDAVVELHAGADHSTLMTQELKTRIRRAIAARFLETRPGGAKD